MNNFVIFGASGDLAKVKLFPALWEINQKDYKCNYFGYGRTNFSNQEFGKIVKDSVSDFDKDFISRFSYITGNYDIAGLQKLREALSEGKTTYYLSLPTRFEIIENLIIGMRESGLFERDFQIVIEKPFGTDYSSASNLMEFLKKNVGEENLFLIDHYLAKDLVRNLISLRFANPVFENIWNNKFVQKIEILASESVGIGDRGEFYDKTGAIRDMIQNHVLQILSLVTMNQPSEFSSQSIQDSKRQVLTNLRIFEDTFEGNIEIGQYLGYLKEDDVDSNSKTETYAKLNVEINNDRWRGVPIVIQTGKKLKEKRTQITIYFKGFDDCLWKENCSILTQNKLEINIYPENDIRLFVNSGINTGENKPKQIPLRFGFADERELPLPYANALIDIYRHDKSYTPSIDEILLSWKFVDRIEKWFEGKRKDLLQEY